MQPLPSRGARAAFRSLPTFIAFLAALFFGACQVSENGKEVNTLSFTTLYDSLSRFESVIITITDAGSGVTDTLFIGKVDSKARVQNLPAPHYAGGNAVITIQAFNGGVLVSRVERTFDGRSDSTVSVVIKISPVSAVTLASEAIQIRLGETQPLPKATIVPENLDDKVLLWSSSNPDAVTLTSTDLVAAGLGFSEVRAVLRSDTSRKAVLRVTVIPKDSIPVAQPPEPPAIGSLIPGDGKVTASWAPVSGSDEYNLYYGEGASVDKNSVRVKKASSPWEVKNLKNGTLYAFALSSVNAAGESALGPIQTSTPQAAAVNAPVIDSVIAGNGVVSFTWKPVPDALGYILYYKTGASVDKASTRIPGVSPPYSLTGLVNGTQYAFALSTLTAAGESGLSATVTATPKAPPASNLNYALNPAVYWRSVAIVPNTATVAGSVDSFTVSPALPAGLTLDKATGRIAGTPTAAAGRADYAVKAHGSSGAAVATLGLTVNPPPSGLSYKEASPTYWQSVAIAVNPAAVSGIVDSFTVSPTLPSGLALSRTTGAISGTPAALAPSATYTVTAHNPAGTVTVTLTIKVNGPPSGFYYSLNPASYWQGVAIAANAATVSGSVDSFTVAPALPSGLSLDKATGAITGVPAAASGPSEYVVTARNASGSPTVTLNISVKGPPTALAYNTMSAVYNRTFAITANAASVTGAVDSFTVSPALPAGLSLGKATGAITGTPTAVSPAANYTVTARNPAGAATAVLSIAVQDPISGLSYAVNPAVYWRGVAIASNAAFITGAPDSFTVAPALPAGLLLNKSTGTITGSPTVASAQATYVVTAKTGGVAVTTNLVLTVKESAGGLTYLNAAPIYHRSYAITANTASIGGTTDSFTVAPALPPGLGLNKASGAIAGTPTVASAQAQYTVTAHVGPTTSTAKLDITVREPITGFSYSPNPLSLPDYIPMAAPILPAISGIPDSITVSPALLGGLILNKATGAISGTPNTAGGPTVHTFTAKGGPVTLTFNLTISVYTEPYISYPTQVATYTQGVAITANTPSAVPFGTIDSFKVAPALPAGLFISKANGSITGTATGTSAATDYVVTAWNKAGTGKDTIRITVNAPPSGTYTLNVKAETGLDTGHASGLNVGFSAMTFLSKPGQPFFGVYKFDFSGVPTTGLKSAKVRYKSYGYGPAWNGSAVNSVTFKVYRIKRAWTEGTGNWFWHSGAFRNNGDVLLPNYPLSKNVKDKSTDYYTPTGLLYTEHDIVRPANLTLCQTQAKNMSYPAASIHPDFNTAVPGPANLIDLEIDMTDYVKSILDGTVTDYGYTLQTEGLGTENISWIGIMHKEAGDGNEDETDGNFGAKMILTY